MTVLPRGGQYVSTSFGPIQFGIPHETIKDSLSQDLEVPSVFVVTPELIDLDRGQSFAEIEFPAYYNFFLRRRKVQLVVPDSSMKIRLRAILQESLFGPTFGPSDKEFAADLPGDVRPDLLRESDYFQHSLGGKQFELNQVVEFLILGPDQELTFSHQVRLTRDAGHEVTVWDSNKPIEKVNLKTLSLPPRKPVASAEEGSFQPPTFGVTVLGSSHGFDPNGKTSGFILWVNGSGLLVDPPMDAALELFESGMEPGQVEGVILTHCHADHDAGIFQMSLTEGVDQIKLYSTPHIFGSFLRKYAALLNTDEDVLRNRIDFQPIIVGEALSVGDSTLKFFYSLHSIPTIGFEAFCGDKSLAFSSDTLYDPKKIEELCSEGVVSRQRADALLAFPWGHSLILHEAGIPPIHTPVGILTQLSPEIKDRLVLLHIANKDVPTDKGVQPAGIGLANTIRIIDAPAQQRETTRVV